MTTQNTHATQTHLQPLQRAFHAFRDFCFEHGTLKGHKQFHELASALYQEICALNARQAEPAPTPSRELLLELAENIEQECVSGAEIFSFSRSRCADLIEEKLAEASAQGTAKV